MKKWVRKISRKTKEEKWKEHRIGDIWRLGQDIQVKTEVS